MTTSLTGQTVASTYDQLLHVSDGPGGTEKTIYGGTGTATAAKISTSSFSVGNIRLTGNTISSLNTDGNIVLTPAGAGYVQMGSVQITGGSLSGVSLNNISGIEVDGHAQTTTVALSISGGTTTVNCLNSNVFTLNLTANTSMVFTNGQEGQTVNILLKQDATGGRTVAWPAAFKWPGGTPSSVSSGASQEDLLTATYISGEWYATLIKAFS